MPTTEPRSALVLLEPPDRAALDAERGTLLAEIEAQLPAAILTPSEYQKVAALEARVGDFLAKVEPLFDKHCAAAHKVWKSACNIRGLFTDGPKAIKAKARGLLAGYIAREEDERRDRARAVAEEDRAKAEDRQRQDARLFDLQGQPEIAAAVRAQPIETPLVVLPSAVPEVGLTYRDEWYWEPVGGDTPANRQRSLRMLVSPAALPFVKLDDAALTGFARRYKGTQKVPGIAFRSRKIPVRR